MNRILKSIISIFVITVVIYSCSKKEQTELITQNSQNLELLANKVELTESTNKVSNLFYNLGISKIDVENRNQNTVISLNSEKTFKFRGNTVNLSNYSVSVKEKLITLNEDDRFKIGVSNGKAFIITPEYSGFYDVADIKIKKNIKTFVLIGFLNELLYDKEKFSFSDNFEYALRGGCSFWDQVFSVGIGINSTSAQADLQASMEDDIEEGQVEGCTKVGEPEAVAFTNETVWAQTWCCP